MIVAWGVRPEKGVFVCVGGGLASIGSGMPEGPFEDCL